jgi:hypothetical protein
MGADIKRKSGTRLSQGVFCLGVIRLSSSLAVSRAMCPVRDTWHEFTISNGRQNRERYRRP